MSIFPVLVDSRPAYLSQAAASVSLLTMPLGESTVGAVAADALALAARRAPAILRTFPESAGYREALARAGCTGEVIGAETLAATLVSLEPSDWLLIADPRCLTRQGVDLAPLMDCVAARPRITRHLVALTTNAGGTNERIEIDASGRVRRIQRYYDQVTWNSAAGVAATLVPVSALARTTGLSLTGLVEFRRFLAGKATPSQDIAITARTFDLSQQGAFLQLTDAWLADRAGRPIVAADATVAPSARLAGAVVVQPGATIAADALIVGPCVIGARARIEAGAVVALSVIAPDVTIPAGASVRRVVVADAARLHGPVAGDADTATVHDEAPPRRVYRSVKGVIESVIAITLLIALSPILLLIALMIKLESRGPVFYGDPREARGGRHFRCFKFRTMFVNADAAQRELMAANANQVDGPQFKIDRDPRVTRLGRFLRAVSLDELPQLINVARGQMSLVGPRPSPFRENQICVPWRDARLSVRPGITGLWQVCRHDRSAGDFHQWIYYDIQYVRHMSAMVDLKIVLATIVTLGGKGHVPLTWIIPEKKKLHA